MMSSFIGIYANTAGSKLEKNALCNRWTTPGYGVFFNHKSQIDFGRSLRNHTYLHIRKFAEDSRRDPWCLSQIFPHQTYDCFAAFVFYVRELCQSAAKAGMASLESTVNETLTSDVETTSTERGAGRTPRISHEEIHGQATCVERQRQRL
jgi:hypothetical protein